MSITLKIASFAMAAFLTFGLPDVLAQTTPPGSTRKPGATKAVESTPAAKSSPVVPTAPAKVAILRITCADDIKGTGVSINGEFKGRCPFDVQVPAGELKIEASRGVYPPYEMVFTDEFMVGADVIQRVDIVLNKTRINPKTHLLIDADEAEQRQGEARVREELPRITAAAEGGDLAAMFRLGRIYEWGLVGMVDLTRAARWFDRARLAGHVPSMSAFARLQDHGLGVSVNPSSAISLYQQAASLGDPEGMYFVGTRYMFGLGGVTKDDGRAVEWLERAVAANDPSAMYSLADMLEKQPSQADRVTNLRKAAESLLESRVKDWDFGALNTFNFHMKWKRLNVERSQFRDVMSAREHRYMKRAAESGDGQSIYWLGLAHFVGDKGALKSKVMAERLFREASAKGNLRAAKELKYLLEAQ